MKKLFRFLEEWGWTRAINRLKRQGLFQETKNYRN